LNGPVPTPKFVLRKNQKTVPIPDVPLSDIKLSFDHALPLLDSADAIPVFGLGTWNAKSGEVGAAVRAAIEIGYRHIDCAQAYLNQEEVADAIHGAIADGLVKREDLWITTKIWNTFHSYPAALKSIDDSLQQMRLDYFDLVLIHWPMGYEEGGEMFPFADEARTKMKYSDVDFADTWKALEVARIEGKTRHIGVSNFGIGQIMRLVRMARPVPQVVQVECHVYFDQKMMQEYCASEGIAMIAYSPLASQASPFRTPKDPIVFKDPVITEVAKKHKAENSQVALRWLLNQGVGVIPKSSNKARIEENSGALEVIMSESDMKKLSKLNKNKRFVDLKKRDGHHPHFPW